MQITDEMVEAALRGWCGYGPDADLSKYQQAPETKEAWRRALEAAWRRHEVTQKYAPPLDNSLRECIEDLAGALKTFADKWANVENEREDDDSHFYMHTIMIGDLRRARATLERWGLK